MALLTLITTDHLNVCMVDNAAQRRAMKHSAESTIDYPNGAVLYYLRNFRHIGELMQSGWSVVNNGKRSRNGETAIPVVRSTDDHCPATKGFETDSLLRLRAGRVSLRTIAPLRRGCAAAWKVAVWRTPTPFCGRLRLPPPVRRKTLLHNEKHGIIGELTPCGAANRCVSTLRV